MFYVITYDISDDKRRNKLAKILKDFGERVQFSVFECNLNDKLLERFLKRAEKVMDIKEDSLRVYELTEEQKQKVKVYGKGKVIEDDKDVYIV